MTALSQYDRLESTGLWRETPDAQRLEVFVSFGDATLVLSDKNNNAMAHWSLPAVQRVNPGKRTAIFSPDSEATETLELDDKLMIAAIEKISYAIDRHRPHPGRLRWLILGGIVATVAALAVFWLPNALVRHTVSVVPEAKRLEIGQALLDNIHRVSGQPCISPSGAGSLEILGTRLAQDKPLNLVILPAGVVKATHLPGGYVLLSRALVEDFEEPDVAAGYVLAELFRAENLDPLDPLLRSAGLNATFTLLTTGDISGEILASYAEHLLTKPPSAINTHDLLQKFKTAEVRSTPYAYAEDKTGETTVALIEADPFATTAAPSLLSDGQWVSLQGICSE